MLITVKKLPKRGFKSLFDCGAYYIMNSVRKLVCSNTIISSTWRALQGETAIMRLAGA